LATGCFGDEAEEFSSVVMLKLVEDDYGVLRKFKGGSKLSTYLNVVVQRAFLDFRVQRWGKWRPSAAAERLGPVAKGLEVLLYRDGRSFADAVEILRSHHDVELTELELAELVGKLPARTGRHFEGENALEHVGTLDGVERRVDDRELNQVAENVHEAFGEALSELSDEDRLILRLRFERGLQIARIAETLGTRPRQLYSRVEKIRARMKRALIDRKVDWPQVERVLGWERFEMELDREFEEFDGVDNPGEPSSEVVAG